MKPRETVKFEEIRNGVINWFTCNHTDNVREGYRWKMSLYYQDKLQISPEGKAYFDTFNECFGMLVNIVHNNFLSGFWLRHSCGLENYIDSTYHSFNLMAVELAEELLRAHVFSIVTVSRSIAYDSNCPGLTKIIQKKIKTNHLTSLIKYDGYGATC